MKLLEFMKDLKKVMEICMKEEINPNIWIESKGKIYQIDKIKLESEQNKNDEQISNLTFITTEEGQ